MERLFLAHNEQPHRTRKIETLSLIYPFIKPLGVLGYYNAETSETLNTFWTSLQEALTIKNGEPIPDPRLLIDWITTPKAYTEKMVSVLTA